MLGLNRPSTFDMVKIFLNKREYRIKPKAYSDEVCGFSGLNIFSHNFCRNAIMFFEYFKKIVIIRKTYCLSYFVVVGVPIERDLDFHIMAFLCFLYLFFCQ